MTKSKRRTLVTEALYNRTKAFLAKYPMAEYADIRLMLIGCGDVDSISNETIRRIKNSVGYEEYRTYLSEAKARFMNKKNTVSDTANTEPNYIRHLEKPQTELLNELIREQLRTNESIQTVAILINALLNVWRGSDNDVNENIRGEIDDITV